MLHVDQVQPPQSHGHPPRRRRGAQVALIAAMAVGSVSVWVGNPMLWMWITSRLQSTQARMGPYALMLLGITLTAVALGKVLSWLNAVYGRVMGTSSTITLIMPWRRSLRGGRSTARETDGRRPVTVLDVVMVLSVTIAIIALVTWFVIVKPLPPGLQPGPNKH